MYECAWKKTFPSGNAVMLGVASSPQPTCTRFGAGKGDAAAAGDVVNVKPET